MGTGQHLPCLKKAPLHTCNINNNVMVKVVVVVVGRQTRQWTCRENGETTASLQPSAASKLCFPSALLSHLCACMPATMEGPTRIHSTPCLLLCLLWEEENHLIYHGRRKKRRGRKKADILCVCLQACMATSLLVKELALPLPLCSKTPFCTASIPPAALARAYLLAHCFSSLTGGPMS